MKKQLIAIVLGTAALFSPLNSHAYHGPNDNPSQGSDNSNRAASCSPASARITMKFNDVSALIEQGGSMWQDRANGVAAYEIPRGSGLKVIYAGALWMGGTDVNGQLKLAGLTFRTGNDFWPGPLTVTAGSAAAAGNEVYDPTSPVGPLARRDFGQATIDADQCEFYDEFYSVSKASVTKFYKNEDKLLKLTSTEHYRVAHGRMQKSSRKTFLLEPVGIQVRNQ